MGQRQAALAGAHGQAATMTASDNQAAARLAGDGFCILPQVFGPADIARFRAAVLAAKGLMGHTRAIEHSLHLAGFHRFPALMDLHGELATHATVNRFLAGYYGASPFYAISLTDITINRSQHWHTDLLRGAYAHFLDGGVAWATGERGCIKALVYLQSGKSLRIVPGSHLAPTPLDDVALEKLAGESPVTQLDVEAGDVVMIDIRTLHRGSTDAEMAAPALADNPKILVSTVFGAIHSPLAQAMQLGNAHRMQQWDRRNLK